MELQKLVSFNPDQSDEKERGKDDELMYDR